MLIRNCYAFAGFVGLFLFPLLLSPVLARPEASYRQRRDFGKVPVFAGAESPNRDAAIRFQFKHENEVRGIAFAREQSRLVTLGCDIALYSWDLKSGSQEYQLELNPGGPWDRSISGLPDYGSYLAVSPDCRFAAVIADGSDGSRGIIQVYDIAQKKKVQAIKYSSDLFYAPSSLSFSTKGDRLAIAHPGWGALQWSLAGEKALTMQGSDLFLAKRKYEQFGCAVTHLRGDDVLAVGFKYQPSRLGLYRAESGAMLAGLLIPQQPKKQPSALYQLGLSMDGACLLGVTRGPSVAFEPSEMIHLWDMTTGEKFWTFTHEKYHVGEAALSPDGRYVAVGFLNDPAVHLYRIADSKEVAVFKGHAKGVSCIAFSPDGTMIASGSLDKTAIVWNVKDGLLAAAERPQADKDFARCWDTLRDGKPLEASEAVASLAAAQDDAVNWLEGKLRPVGKPDAAKVKKWLAQLNENVQTKRDEASRELAALGPLIETEVKQALADPPSAEVKRRLEELQRDLRSLWSSDPDTVRAVRAIYVLERVGSDKAVALLKKLAEGEAAARLTREAKISLERLEVRKPSKP